MTNWVNVGGVWKEITQEFVNVGGVWKTVSYGWASPSLNVWKLISPDQLVFSTTGASLFTVPQQVTSIFIKCWGAGGGGGYTDGPAEGGSGGAGGYAEGYLSVTEGQQFYVFVPYGGLSSQSVRVSAAGGSFAGVFRTTGVPIIIAAGGGGGGCGRYTGKGAKNGGGGGGGGGLTGSAGQNTPAGSHAGGGGTQSSGGAGGSSGGTNGSSGLLYRGGDGAASSAAGRGENGAANYSLAGPGGTPAAAVNASWGFGGDRSGQADDRSGGGGGGSGLYGGGGAGQSGNDDNGGGCGGGGGSSYIGGLTSGASTISGSTGSTVIADVAAPNNTDPDYISGVGVGRIQSSASRGGNGLVVIRFFGAN